ncbi:MAG: hypothetical protein Q9M17_07385 [Mariprofundus sp.]|nr:hypothetical protein [Mariprofundus sp.]
MAVLALVLGALWAAYMATHHESLHGGFEAELQNVQESQQRHHDHGSSGQSSSEQGMPDMQMDMMTMDAPVHEGHEHAEALPETQHEHAHNMPDNHHDHAGTAHAKGAQHSHSGSLATDAMQRLLRGHIHFMGIGVLAAVLLLITAFTSLKSCWKKVLGWTFGIGTLAYPPAWIVMGFRTVELGPEAAEASIMWLFGPAVGLLLASISALLVILLLEMLSLQHRIPMLRNCFVPDSKVTEKGTKSRRSMAKRYS